MYGACLDSQVLIRMKRFSCEAHTYGHIWTIYGHIWTIYGHIWAIYGPYMSIYGELARPKIIAKVSFTDFPREKASEPSPPYSPHQSRGQK